MPRTGLRLLLLSIAGLWAMGNAPCGDGKACPEKTESPDTRLPKPCLERDLEPLRTRGGMVRIPRRIRCDSARKASMRLPAFWLDSVATPRPGPLDTAFALDFCRKQGKRLPSETELREAKKNYTQYFSWSVAELTRQSLCLEQPPDSLRCQPAFWEHAEPWAIRCAKD